MVRVDEVRFKSLDNWREEAFLRAGPMDVRAALAQQLDTPVERSQCPGHSAGKPAATGNSFGEERLPAQSGNSRAQ